MQISGRTLRANTLPVPILLSEAARMQAGRGDYSCIRDLTFPSVCLFVRLSVCGGGAKASYLATFGVPGYIVSL